MLMPHPAPARRTSTLWYLLAALLLVPLGAGAALLIYTACGRDVEVPAGRHRYQIVRYDPSLSRDIPQGLSHQMLVGPGDQTDATVFRCGAGSWLFGERREVHDGP